MRVWVNRFSFRVVGSFKDAVCLVNNHCNIVTDQPFDCSMEVIRGKNAVKIFLLVQLFNNFGLVFKVLCRKKNIRTLFMLIEI